MHEIRGFLLPLFPGIETRKVFLMACFSPPTRSTDIYLMRRVAIRLFLKKWAQSQAFSDGIDIEPESAAKRTPFVV